MADTPRFLDDVGRELRLRGLDRVEILQELRDHLDDSSRALEHEGLDPGRAAYVAYERLGSPAELAQALKLAHRRPWMARLSAAIGRGRGPIQPIAASAVLVAGALVAGVVAAGATAASTPNRVNLDLAAGAGSLGAGPFGEPNLVFILIAAGIAGLLFELVHPNLATGLVGGIALAVGLAAAVDLPLSLGGVLLLTLSVGLLFLEAHLPSHGLLTGLGLAGFVVGGAIFYGAPAAGHPSVAVSWQVIAAAAAVALAFAIVIVTAAVRLRRTAPALVAPGLAWTGIGMLGQVGEVHSDLAPDGSIHVAGEEWSARLADGSASGVAIRRGLHVRVIGQERLTLLVRAIE